MVMAMVNPLEKRGEDLTGDPRPRDGIADKSNPFAESR
jgi:hypothetical protein